MRQKLELVIVILVIMGLLWVNRNMKEYVTSDEVKKGETLIVIDAGHGGKDPGKVGVNDALEKDINLEIAKQLQKHLQEKGIEVLMIREEDEMLASEDSRNKKVEDMKERVKRINESEASMVVSIHQNSYQDGSVHGAQVFYYTHSTEGEQMAVVMQEALLQVDETNTRKAKANDTYYLLKRTTIPTVIVECGFLSNAEEAKKLVTEEYQEEVAKAIAQGILACLSE